LSDLSKAPDRIAGMFDAIAGRYDLLNHLLSAGIDRRWRRVAIASLRLSGRERVLDVCTGTADLVVAALTARPGAAHVVGVDFSGAMLRVGQAKLVRQSLAHRASLLRADATRLPLRDGAVDALTVAFGIRNVERTSVACAEMRRVVAPGGRLAILEFAVPTCRPVRAAYLWYFNHVLPRIGRLIAQHDAYSYLPASVSAFSSPDEFQQLLRESGFTNVSARPLTFGIVYLYGATTPAH
jgi:demethylmenaquinone methyltransferase/2-methoxy-6-polyprenyl-1,4-benzoquinol methylase